MAARSRAIQARDPVLDFAACGDDEHGDIVPLCAQGPEDGKSVGARQHDIQQYGVIGIVLGKIKPLFAVMGDVHGEVVFFKAFFEETGELLLVFDYQYLHRFPGNGTSPPAGD
jgi:hypothetical protein